MIFTAVVVRAIIETGSMFLVHVIRRESTEHQVEDDREWSQVDPEHSRLRVGHSSCLHAKCEAAGANDVLSDTDKKKRKMLERQKKWRATEAGSR